MDDTIIEYVVEEDGRIEIEGLPVHRGDRVLVHLLRDAVDADELPFPTVADWRRSGLIGMWSGREDVADSIEFVDRLRARESLREGVFGDPDRQ